jgi:hypothetical protein
MQTTSRLASQRDARNSAFGTGVLYTSGDMPSSMSRHAALPEMAATFIVANSDITIADTAMKNGESTWLLLPPTPTWTPSNAPPAAIINNRPSEAYRPPNTHGDGRRSWVRSSSPRSARNQLTTTARW